MPRFPAELTLSLIAILAISIVELAGSEARADWGGTALGSGSSSNIEGVRSQSWDQQYTLFTTGRPTQKVRYSLGAVFRHLQSQTDGTGSTWLTETRPSGSLNWTTPILDLRADGSYRSDRTASGTSKLTAGATSFYGQTTLTSLPRLFASWNWAKNTNNVELLGYDTRTRAISAGGNYSTHFLYANYEFSDVLTRNETSGLDRVSQSHGGRADLTRALLDKLVNVSASYQASTRKETDYSTFSGEALIVVRAVAGLYAADPSPEFDALDNVPALVDGLLEVSAGTDYDLVNGTTHNFGLDFGLPVAIDHIHLYVDSLAALPLTWSIWQSSDNLNWAPVASNVSAPFSSLFLRYEFAFSPVQTRYLKVSVTPQLLNTPLEVTEIRGLIAQTEIDPEDRTTDQRASARVMLTPSKWLNWDLSGDAVRQGASLTTLARKEDGIQTSMRLDPARAFDLALRYSWSRSNYTDADLDYTYSEAAGAVLRSQWSRSVSTNLSADRLEESSGNFLQRRTDRNRVEVRMLLLPALRMTSQFAYAEDERFDSRDKLYSRTFANDFEGEPTDRSQISVTYRYETRSARVSAVRKYQISLGGRLTYRLTDTIHLVGNATSTTDPSREDRGYDALASWAPSHKLSVGAAFNRIEGSNSINSNQYSVQTVYNVSLKTELSASYSLNEREQEPVTSSARVSLFTRF